MKLPKLVRPLALSLVVISIAGRLLPHPPNFTPVGASSLFAGARLRGWQAFMVPLLAMSVTDPILGAILGFKPFGWMTLFVYGSFMVNVALGRWQRNSNSPLRLGTLSLLASTQFFLITNFGVWLTIGGPVFPHTWAGLLACYAAGIPYFGRTLLGDMIYSGALFGIHAWLSRRLRSFEAVTTPS